MSLHDSAASRMLRTLSLDALRGFEAAARQLSFTAAAEELCLTQSAISKQVRLLEEAIGKPVFVRGSRGLSLTPDGRRLYEGVHHTLQQLESAIEAILEPERKSVAVTVTPSFASLWLAQKLAAYRLLEPSVDVRVDASEVNVALDREGFDLAIRLSQPEDAPSSWKPLMRERLVLVAAPQLADLVSTRESLLTVPLLVFHHPIERYPWMSWTRWYDQLQLAKPTTQPVFQFSQYEHVVKAAVEGVGVAIGRMPLVLPLLRDGRLKVVVGDASADGLTYYLLLSDRAKTRPEVLGFVEWIEEELAADLRS